MYIGSKSSISVARQCSCELPPLHSVYPCILQHPPVHPRGLRVNQDADPPAPRLPRIPEHQVRISDREDAGREQEKAHLHACIVPRCTTTSPGFFRWRSVPSSRMSTTSPTTARVCENEHCRGNLGCKVALT